MRLPLCIIDCDMHLSAHEIEKYTYRQGTGQASALNARTPATTRVCRESRAWAFERDVPFSIRDMIEGITPDQLGGYYDNYKSTLLLTCSI
jgi:hypothetical protein